MAVESSTTISGLNAAWPLGTDIKAEGDNHIRLVKSALQAVFDDSGTTIKHTKPIESPNGAKLGTVTVTGDITQTGNFAMSGSLTFSGTSPQGLRFTDADMSWIERKTPSNRLALNSKADGSGTDVLFVDASGNVTGTGTAKFGSIINSATTAANTIVVGHSGSGGGLIGVAGFAVDPANGMIIEHTGTMINANKIGSNGGVVAFYQGGVLCGSISVANANSTAYNTSSDERLKDFIGPYDPQKAIDIIRADPVRDFTWISDGSYAVGWGAQTSYAVSEDLATPAEGDNPWGIDQSKRTPYLWAALSWALDRIDDLEGRLSAMEAAR